MDATTQVTTQDTMQVGTLTNQGVYLGMQGRLARFERNLGERTTTILCAPTLAHVISQEDEDARLKLEEDWIGQGPWYQAVLRGDEARSALSSFKQSFAI